VLTVNHAHTSLSIINTNLPPFRCTHLQTCQEIYLHSESIKMIKHKACNSTL